MKFFLDFEAHQFSNDIISIGCACENGKTFSTFVRLPERKKITKFITALTGITNEMIAEAPNADSAFLMLYDFVLDNSLSGDMPEYYCYGDSDSKFIEKTASRMTSFLAHTFAISIANSLIDYSEDVRQFFNTPDNIGLRRVYTLIKAEDVEQHHDALEDAQMLSEVVLHLKETCRPEDKELLIKIPPQPKPYIARKKAPEFFVSWPPRRWDADTFGTPSQYAVMCRFGPYEKYFDSFYTATLWVIRYLAPGTSPKRENDVKHVQKVIKNAVVSGKKSYNCAWFCPDPE